MKKQTDIYDLVIGVLARDCETKLRKNIERIERLRSYFEKTIVVVVENDSIDSTKKILQEWYYNHADSIIIDSFNQNSVYETGQSISRIERMVYCRNRLLKNIRALGEARFVVFIDIDVEEFYPHEIYDAIIKMPKDIGACFANSTIRIIHGHHSFYHGLQYDTYAYMGINETISKLQKYYANSNATSQSLRGKILNIKLLFSKYIRCKSAFGGIGIYRGEALNNLSYECKTLKKGKAFCEHILFNLGVMEKGYNLIINRDLHCIYNHFNVSFIKYLIYAMAPLTVNYISNIKHSKE